MAIDGFRLACLIDGSTGMVLATREFLQSRDGPAPPIAAAGAADVIHALTLLNGRMATGENLEDVMVTFSDSFFMVRPVGLDQPPQILLLVIADRQRTNLAMAHRSIRDFCASFTS
jgi:hypothetical protein